MTGHPFEVYIPAGVTAAGRRLRQRARHQVSKLFDAPDPLQHTQQWPGDPGVCGPGSVSWQIIGDVSAFVAGIRALLLQACHPDVVAGFLQHSRFRHDPLGRLGRTSAYVTATTFGATPEVEAAVAAVRRAHRPVNGVSPDGSRYRADDPDLAAWVHNALVDSFLTAYDTFGPAGRFPAEDQDRFVVEQGRIGRLLGVEDLPTTAAALRTWVDNHPEAGPSPGLNEAVEFLRDPPLPGVPRLGYQLLYRGAVSLLSSQQQTWLGERPRCGDRVSTATLVTGLRHLLGARGPSVEAATRRVEGGEADQPTMGNFAQQDR